MGHLPFSGRLGGRRPSTADDSRPLACVLGDVDLVAALGRGGIGCVAVVGRGDPARYSRFTQQVLDLPADPSCPQQVVELLVRWAATQPVRPVLYYNTDRDLLLVSRYRDELSQHFRFVIADAELVEALVDKARFQEIAAKTGLDVPRATVLRHGEPLPPLGDLTFPLLLKPLTRRALQELGADPKAFRVDTRDDLDRTWAWISRSNVDALAQELVAGGENRIESYHAYRDATGEIVADLSGRKIRTMPLEYGHSTALEITDCADVRESGRDVITRLGLTGVVKVDFKRDPSGRLRVLEVNPRFSLWHHLTAAAGANLPALVYADLLGLPRPSSTVRVGTTWCHPDDRWAARLTGMSPREWLAWAGRCDARSGADWNDPLPFVLGYLLAAARRKTRSVTAGMRRRSEG